MLNGMEIFMNVSEILRTLIYIIRLIYVAYEMSDSLVDIILLDVYIVSVI